MKGIVSSSEMLTAVQKDINVGRVSRVFCGVTRRMNARGK